MLRKIKTLNAKRKNEKKNNFLITNSQFRRRLKSNQNFTKYRHSDSINKIQLITFLFSLTILTKFSTKYFACKKLINWDTFMNL